MHNANVLLHTTVNHVPKNIKSGGYNKGSTKKFVNEVANILEASWWAPHESLWKIAQYTVHKYQPNVNGTDVISNKLAPVKDVLNSSVVQTMINRLKKVSQAVESSNVDQTK